MTTLVRGNLFKARGRFTTRELTEAEEAAFDADGSLPVGVGQDPTTVSVKVKDPAGVVTTYNYPADPEVVKQVAGSYYILIDADRDRRWWVRWESTGTGQAASEIPFYVKSEVV